MSNAIPKWMVRLVAYPLLFLIMGSYIAAKLGYLNVENMNPAEPEVIQRSALTRSLLQSILNNAVFCLKLKARTGKIEAYHSGFDYRDYVFDESLKLIADEFATLLVPMQETVKDFVASANLPSYSISFIRRCSSNEIDSSQMTAPKQNSMLPERFQTVLSAHENFVKTFLDCLNGRLEQAINDAEIEYPDNSKPLFDDMEIIRAHSEDIFRFLREIKSSVDESGCKKVDKIKSLSRNELPDDLYQPIDDYAKRVEELHGMNNIKFSTKKN